MASQNAGPAFISASALAEFTGTQNGGAPWLFAANNALYLYQLKINAGGGGINGSGIFKSTDGGNTWAEVDSAHAPTSAVGSPFFDTANNRLVLGLVTETSPATPQSTFLKTFSFATELWGANFATGGPNAVNVVQATFVRPDTSVVILYDFGSANPGGTSRYRAAVWNGSSWSASIDMGSASLGCDATGNILVSAVQATMEPATGVIHSVYNNNGLTCFYYQQLHADNTLGASNAFSVPNFSGNTFGSLILYKTSLLASYQSNTGTKNNVLIGTPLSAPVWSTVTPAVGVYTHINKAGPLATDGSTIYWLFNFFDPTFVYVGFQLATSTDGGNTWAIVPDNIPEPFFYDSTPGQSPNAPNSDFTFGVNNPALFVISSTAYGFGNVRNTSVGRFIGYFFNSESFACGACRKYQ